MFLANLILAIAWAALTGSFTPGNVLVGFVFAFIALTTLQPDLGQSGYFRKVPRVLSFALFYLQELLLANLRVAYTVIMPRPRMRPGVVGVPLDARTDAEITLLANLITLTPGTLSLDVSPDRSVLYIHALDVADAESFRAEIKDGLERRVLEVLR